MQQSFVAKRRFFDDRNFPKGFTRSGRFTLAEGNLLEKHGAAMQELEDGQRQPVNDEVSAFTDESKFARHVRPLASFIILISQFVIA